MSPRRSERDEEPVGSTYRTRQGRWTRPWSPYLAFLCGFVGLVALIGVWGNPTPPGTLAVVCLVLSPFAVVRADQVARRRRSDRAARPLELAWSAVWVMLLLLGVLLLLVSGSRPSLSAS